MDNVTLLTRFNIYLLVVKEKEVVVAVAVTINSLEKLEE